MDLTAWKHSLAAAQPPAALSPFVEALWWEARGDWERAHTLARDTDGRDGAWVHAYLHRREGDDGNAGYWYRRAGKPHSPEPLEQERDALVAALLAEGK